MIALIYRYSNANKRLQRPCAGSPRSHRASPHLKAAVIRDKSRHLWAASAPKSRNETQLTSRHYSRETYKTFQKQLKGSHVRKQKKTEHTKQENQTVLAANLKKRTTITRENKQQPDTNYLHFRTVDTTSLVPPHEQSDFRTTQRLGYWQSGHSPGFSAPLVLAFSHHRIRQSEQKPTCLDYFQAQPSKDSRKGFSVA